MNLWRNTQKTFAIMTPMVAIFATGVAWHEYKNQIQRDKVAKSFDLVRQFYDERTSHARIAILRPWLPYDVDRINRAGPSKNMVKAIIEKVAGVSARDDNAFLTNIITITEYIDFLQECAAADLCDRGVLTYHISSFDRDFYCLYGDFITSQRRRLGLETFGIGLSAMALQRSPCEQ